MYGLEFNVKTVKFFIELKLSKKRWGVFKIMSDVYNTTNNLYWVFTNYGKERLISLNADDPLFLYKAGIGCYNWYEDPLGYFGGSGYSEGTFKRYFESTDEKSIGQLVPNGMIAISTKNLVEETDEDGKVIKRVVELSVTVPENLSDFDIREMAIYETIDGTDHLFAICTMQPIPKPSIETNHYISAILTARLQSEMLADAYEQIVLDPSNNFVTIDELNDFQENLLFVESNLAEQISNNSRIIGYDRPQQLYEQIIADKKKYSSFAVSTTYANALNIANLEDIKSFWIFQPNNDTTSSVSIPDLSYYGINMATDKLITLYETGYEGLSPWINFEYNERSDSGNYYMLDSDVDFDFVKEEGGVVTDSPFTLFFVGAQNSNEHDCTIIAKDNSAQSVGVQPAFQVTVTDKRQIKVIFYQNRANYVEYITGVNSVPEAGKFYVASLTYSPVINTTDNILIPRFKIMINGKEVSGNIKRTGNYQGMTKTILPLTSRIHTSNGYTNYVDSKICLLSLFKKELSTDYIRAMTYNMMALIGVNPCLIQ